MAGYPYRSLPAVKIGRLGVRSGMQKAGAESNIIKMINLLMQTDNRTGCRLMTVDAYVDAVPFYIRNGFDIA